MDRPPTCVRSASTNSWPTTPTPGGSPVARANVTSMSGQGAADAVADSVGAPSGASMVVTIRAPAKWAIFRALIRLCWHICAPGGGPYRSARRCEELQGHAVRVAEAQTRTVGRVDDSPVLDMELVEPVHPGFEFGPAGAAEADVVEADPEFAEPLIGCRMLVLVDAEQGPAVEDPHQMPESRGRVLVDHGVGVEQPAVPGAADRHVAHRECDVIECRKSHDWGLLLTGCQSAGADGRFKCDLRLIFHSRVASATFTSAA